jgi:site-specific DNA-methyltransferase (adenine-specific)
MKLLLGDCLDKLKELEDNSVDSIVTDPPYGLAFMGKQWDYDVPSQEIWEECMRVLKPGGHLLAFAGSRTYHRMAVRIEDAGFEIRDQIMWVYGCLTEDTEILTKEGWKHYHKITKDDIYSKGEILVYDTERDIYKWERPERWYVYSLNEDTVYRIRGNQTDQLVSKDHNCLIERNGNLVFTKSQDLGDMERVPILQNDFSFLQEGELQVLQLPMQRQSEGGRMERVGEDRREDFQSTSQQNEESKLRRKKWILEGWNNLQKEEGVLLQCKNKIREVSRRIQKYGKKRWLRDRIPTEGSSTFGEITNTSGVCPSHRPQPRKQRDNQSNVIQEQLRPQEIRSGTSYTTDLATITKEAYSGVIFCPNTSTGAFVARRNGKVFITGNSGFPKSMNIGKGVDKLQGNKREVVGTKGLHKYTPKGMNHTVNYRSQDFDKANELTKGTSEWEGWGTALKPAHEPIVMARKPFKGSVAENVLEWGTGGINIDGCRIGTEEIFIRGGGGERTGWGKKNQINETRQGRFPANLILDEEAGKMLDEQSGMSKSLGGTGKISLDSSVNLGDGNNYFNYGDTGGASRFFYCPKTSKTDRNEGLDEFDAKPMACGNQAKAELKRGNLEFEGKGDGTKHNKVSMRVNTHPTVKPTDLMAYLIRLVTPKGGTVLDPFMGSGSTGKGAVRGGFDFIGIEREQEYFKIAEARIQYEKTKPNGKVKNKPIQETEEIINKFF